MLQLNILASLAASFAAHEVATTVAMFAPRTAINFGFRQEDDAAVVQQLVVTAGYNGELKFIENRGKPKAV